jgi:hypothetical protein
MRMEKISPVVCVSSVPPLRFFQRKKKRKDARKSDSEVKSEGKDETHRLAPLPRMRGHGRTSGDVDVSDTRNSEVVVITAGGR